MYKRRNDLINKILSITKDQLNAVIENRIDDYLESCAERERCFEELLATEMDIKAVVENSIRTNSSEVAVLNAGAREMLESICSIEPDIKEKLELLMQDVEKEIGNIKKGRDTLKAYHTGRDMKRREGISKRG